MAPRFIAGVLVLLAVVGVLTTALRKPTVKKTIEPNVTIIARDFHDSGPIATRRAPVTNPTSSPKHKARPRPKSKAQTTTQIAVPKSPKRPPPSRKPKAVKIKPDRRRPARRPSRAPPQASNPPPQPHQKPPVDVDVPAPVTVCVDRVGGVNCS